MLEFFPYSNDLWEVVPVPKAPEKLCSLLLHLPVESFRTKGLPAQHVQHTGRTNLFTLAESTFCYGLHLQPALRQISLPTDSTAPTFCYKANDL